MPFSAIIFTSLEPMFRITSNSVSISDCRIDITVIRKALKLFITMNAEVKTEELRKYLINSPYEQVAVLEIEFREYEESINRMLDANKEMEELDATDKDLAQAQLENLELIEEKKQKMIETQEKMRGISASHPILKENVKEKFKEKESFMDRVEL